MHDFDSHPGGEDRCRDRESDRLRRWTRTLVAPTPPGLMTFDGLPPRP